MTHALIVETVTCFQILPKYGLSMRQIEQRGEKIYSGQEILDRQMDGKMDGQTQITIFCQQSLTLIKCLLL